MFSVCGLLMHKSVQTLLLFLSVTSWFSESDSSCYSCCCVTVVIDFVTREFTRYITWPPAHLSFVASCWATWYTNLVCAVENEKCAANCF